MGLKFFDAEPDTWQALEQMVAQAFSEMGYESYRNYPLDTARGKVDVDVFAVNNTSSIPTQIICECKHWNKPIPQNVVHGFRSVCSDSGVHVGIIISKCGFQSGAQTSTASTNIHLYDFHTFQTEFFQEWKRGAFMMLSKMRDQLLPIFRSAAGIENNGTDTVGHHEIVGSDVCRKLSIFFGLDGSYSQYFIFNQQFPATIPDPRGDLSQCLKVTVKSHREYLEIARQAVIDHTTHFALPKIHFSDQGDEISPKC